jgi:hypothetical protein
LHVRRTQNTTDRWTAAAPSVRDPLAQAGRRRRAICFAPAAPAYPARSCTIAPPPPAAETSGPCTTTWLVCRARVGCSSPRFTHLTVVAPALLCAGRRAAAGGGSFRAVSGAGMPSCTARQSGLFFHGRTWPFQRRAVSVKNVFVGRTPEANLTLHSAMRTGAV